MRFLKSIGVVAVYFGILLATLFVVGLQDNLPGLERYQCQEGHFSVLLPGQPEQRQQGKVKALRFKNPFAVVSAGTKKSRFGVVVYPIETEVESRLLKMGWKGKDRSEWDIYMATGELGVPGGEIAEEKDLTYQGFAAKEYLMELLKRKVVRVRVISTPERRYYMVVWSKSKSILNTKAAEFFDSLEIEVK
jgi:hypothetical protein